MQLLPKWSVKPFAKPYVAGIKTYEVLNVVKSLNKDGFSATVDILVEFVSNKDEAIDQETKIQLVELKTLFLLHFIVITPL